MRPAVMSCLWAAATGAADRPRRPTRTRRARASVGLKTRNVETGSVTFLIGGPADALGEIRHIHDKPGLYFKLPVPFQNVAYHAKRILPIEGPIRYGEWSDGYDPEDFAFENYDPHPHISAPVAV